MTRSNPNDVMTERTATYIIFALMALSALGIAAMGALLSVIFL